MISWLATFLSVAGAVYVARHRNRGNAIWLLANLLWVAIFLQAGELAPVVLFAFYEATAAYGFWNWRKAGVEL